MGVPVLILGESGTGKSYSLRNFEPDEISIINVLGKPMPFKTKGKAFSTRDMDRVRAAVRKAPTRSIVVDDFGYLITDMYMRYSYGDERMRDQFDVYKKIAHEVYGFVNDVYAMPEDTIVYMTMHTDTTVSGSIQPLTVGKLLNEKIKLVGMVTALLLARVQGGNYEFVTNGIPPAKTPPGMFPETIPNDLAAVDATMREFWGMTPIITTKED